MLTDIIYQFKELKEYPPYLQKVLLAQMHFKSVLEIAVISKYELEKMQLMKNDEDRYNLIKKKSFK